MAQNLAGKRFYVAYDAARQAAAVLAAADRLTEDAGALTQAGGNFDDTDFDGTGVPNGLGVNASSLIYLSAYQANVFHQSVIPALNTWLDSHLDGDAGLPTHRQYFQTMITGLAT